MITKPPPAAHERRRRLRLGALVPAGVLVLGLVGVAVVVASNPRLSLRTLELLFNSRQGISARGLYPITEAKPWSYAPYSPFGSEMVRRSWGLTIGLTVTYLGFSDSARKRDRRSGPRR
jgi:hypothetical protein